MFVAWNQATAFCVANDRLLIFIALLLFKKFPLLNQLYNPPNQFSGDDKPVFWEVKFEGKINW